MKGTAKMLLWQWMHASQIAKWSNMDLYHASSFSMVFARLKKLFLFQFQCNCILSYFTSPLKVHTTFTSTLFFVVESHHLTPNFELIKLQVPYFVNLSFLWVKASVIRIWMEINYHFERFANFSVLYIFCKFTTLFGHFMLCHGKSVPHNWWTSVGSGSW